MDLVPYVVTWSILASVVVATAIYRRVVTDGGQQSLTGVEGGERNIRAREWKFVDRWAAILTLAAALHGAVLAGAYAYAAWAGG